MEKVEKLIYNKNRWLETENMENGERRIRLKISNKLIFSETVTTNTSGWQNPHYHIHATEKYIVKKGNIIIAIKEKEKEKMVLKTLRSGERIIIPPNIEHNVYVNKYTSFYVLKKSPEILNGDWYNSTYFDINI